MSCADQLFALQCAQLDHDESFHKDVVILPLGERVKHMALHNAKYTGQLFDILDAADAPRLTRLLTDAFIIVLATANTLNQDLGLSLQDVRFTADVQEAGTRLAELLERDDGDPVWFISQMARANGRLAKACESLDHLEDVTFRRDMCASNLDLLKSILAEASARKIDVVAMHAERTKQISRRSIFERRSELGRR